MSYPYGQGPGYPGYPPQPGFQMPEAGYPSSPGYPPAGTTPYPATQSFPIPQSGGQYPGAPLPSRPYIPGQAQPYQPPSQAYQPPSQPSYPGYPSQQPGYQPPPSHQPYQPPSQGYPPSQPQYQPPQQGYPSAPARPYTPQGQHQQQHSSFNPYTPPNKGKLSTMATPYYEQGTVKDYPNFDPEADSKALRKAMKGFGTDEKAIIDVLAHRTNRQRLQIVATYKTLFGRDLIDDLKSELSGKFEDVIIALMSPLPKFLAKELHKAISGLGTDEDTLVEILCTRSNEEIRAINHAYREMYNTTLEKDLISDTSGHFRKLMVSMSTGGRNEASVDPERARHDAKVLFEAGEGQWGTDESTLNAILASQSYPQLRHVFYEYYQLTGRTLEQALDSELSGELKDGMMAIAKSVENRAGYFADKLYKAMKGLGTDDRTLIRIVASRSEIDMVQIKENYQEKYGKPLADAIADDVSGEYKSMLVAMVGEEP